MTALSRPYDIVMPTEFLEKLKERRRSPTGIEHKVEFKTRGSAVIYRYPWDRMELGDFFVAKIGTKSEKSMRVGFHQTAARRDYEIWITNWRLSDGSSALRVCLTIINVNQWKTKLDLQIDEDLMRPEGKRLFDKVPRPRFADVTKRRLRKRTGVDATRQKKQRERRNREAEELYGKKQQTPFWADDDPLPVEPVAMNPIEQDVKLTRAEAIARALKLAGEG